jgi:hypothetical protein
MVTFTKAGRFLLAKKRPRNQCSVNESSLVDQCGFHPWLGLRIDNHGPAKSAS